jgi:hypothetical protein
VKCKNSLCRRCGLSATFIALYRGESISGAKLLAVTANQKIVDDLARRLLDEPEIEGDPANLELERGRRRALQVVCGGGTE